ncbi:MAG: 4a-hydroxytetrahydrobiopterin dehydratase [Thaumarchaeota archaeon]|nr:MAG: 4a-hydroxytetrahydrobiopterin dehydratase [Nitrososphaerota archaeon]
MTMNSYSFGIIFAILLVIVTSICISASAQTLDTRSKINTTIITINPSNIKSALTSVYNNTSPHYVKLSDSQIYNAFKDLPGWTIHDGKLHKTFTFADFSTLFEFLYQVADSSKVKSSSKYDIHMELTIDYDTWSLGHVISNFDVKAANTIEKLYQDSNYADIDN